jgi:hypothetical protein
VHPTTPRLLLPLCALLLTAGCDPTASRQAETRRKMAEATLAEASEEIQERVGQTCDRWRDTAGECDSDRAYEDVLECWLEKGLPSLKKALDHGMRQRARNRRTVLHHSLCMERRGWRLRPGSGGYF